MALTSEFYKACRVSGPDGSQELWGVSVRLIVKFDAKDFGAEVSFPMVAAKAQLGQVRAEYRLDVRGFRGSEAIADFIPSLGEFNVET